MLSGWRSLGQVKDPERFEGFIREYFPPEYHAHAPALYVLRCRMLHNSSPEGFVLVHGSWEHHLTRLDDGPVKLVDVCVFEAVQVAAERFFDELRRDSYRQSVMKQRLEVGPRGGAVHVIGIARGPGAG